MSLQTSMTKRVKRRYTKKNKDKWTFRNLPSIKVDSPRASRNILLILLWPMVVIESLVEARQMEKRYPREVQGDNRQCNRQGLLQGNSWLLSQSIKLPPPPPILYTLSDLITLEIYNFSMLSLKSWLRLYDALFPLHNI